MVNFYKRDQKDRGAGSVVRFDTRDGGQDTLASTCASRKVWRMLRLYRHSEGLDNAVFWIPYTGAAGM
jgi:hypothetical protein